MATMLESPSYSLEFKTGGRADGHTYAYALTARGKQRTYGWMIWSGDFKRSSSYVFFGRYQRLSFTYESDRARTG